MGGGEERSKPNQKKTGILLQRKTWMALVGYKAAKLTTEGQDWEAWDKAGRLYALIELEILADAAVGARIVPPPLSFAAWARPSLNDRRWPVVPHKEEHKDTVFFGKRRTDRAVIKNITALDGKPIDHSFIARSGLSPSQHQ